MWVHLGYFLIGAWAGATIGVISMALCAGARAAYRVPKACQGCEHNPANYGAKSA